MTDFRFSASAFSVDFNDPDAAFDMLARVGFSGIEGEDQLTGELASEQIAALRERADRRGVPFTSFHLPFTPRHDIAAFYETDRREAVRLLERSMHRAAALGAGTVIIHPSSRLLDVTVEDADGYERRLVRSLESLADTAGSLGLRIAVENMMQSTHTCYFALPEHIASFRDRFDHPSVGFCLDTGHALIAIGPERQIDVMKAMDGKLIAFHLQDNPGDRDLHIAPGRGNVDFGSIFARARNAGIDEVMCIETPPFTPEHPYAEASWAALLADTRSLANG